MKFEPPLASKSLEELMEKHDIAESDREELRAFAQFLGATADKQRLTPEVKRWALGQDKQEPPHAE